MKPRMLFDHVPRTGGTSVARALAQAVGEQVDLEGYQGSHRDALARAGGRRLVAGHLWFAPREPLHPEWHYSTIVRDPVDRFLSQYSYNRSVAAVHGTEEQRRDPQVVAAASHTLDEYLALDIPAVDASYRNYQAVHFAQRRCEYPRNLDDSTLFEAAIASLEEYDLVGVFDDLPGFVRAACLGLALGEVAVGHANASPGGERLARPSAEALGKLASANAVDHRLHAWARERWQRESVHRNTSPRAATSRGPRPFAFGSRDIRMVAVSHEPPDGVLDNGAIRIDCIAFVAEPDLTIGIAVYDGDGTIVLGTNSRLLGMRVPVSAPMSFTARFALPGPLAPGEYSVTAALHVGLSHEEGCYHWCSDAARFVVPEKRAGNEPASAS